MRGFHFSLRWLFGVVSFLALGCGLLMYGSPLTSKLAFTATVVALLSAVSTAVYGSGERRAFWGGFAAFGFAYLWTVCGTWQCPDGSTTLRERLLTSDLLIRCQDALPASQTSANASTSSPVMSAQVLYLSALSRSYAKMVPASMSSGADRTDFLTTGHSLFAILFALLGGAITRRCSSRARAVAG